MNELIETTEATVGIPHLGSVRDIWYVEQGQLAYLQEVTFQGCTPKKSMRGSAWDRVRQVALGIPYDTRSQMMVVVQDCKAADGQLAPVQGGIKRKETVYEAFVREGCEEAGVVVPLEKTYYVGSALCPVPEDSFKSESFDYQLFHCLISHVHVPNYGSLRVCDRTGEYATLLHCGNFWPLVKKTASATKRSLLKQVLEESMRRQLITERLSLH